MPIADLILGLLRLGPRPVTTHERRESLRLQCDVDILLWVEGEIHKAKVLDVHMTGLCLEAVEPLKVGQKISLARDDFGHPWAGEVLWCKARSKSKRYLAGVGFPTDPEMLRNSWLQPALMSIGFQEQLLGEKRKFVRVPGQLMPCRLLLEKQELTLDGTAVNLSLGGARVEIARELRESQEVSFETNANKGIPALKSLCAVIYCQALEDGRWACGLRFKTREEADIRKVMASRLLSR